METSLAIVAQLVECHPGDRRVAGVTLGQNTCLGCGLARQLGHAQKVTRQCFSQFLLSLPHAPLSNQVLE